MYLQHFGLSGPPFQFTTSLTAMFMSHTHREGVAALEWGLLYEPSGLTLVAGETGLGKTTLVCSLLARRHRQVRSVYLANAKLRYEELLADILRQLGVQSDGGKAAMLTAFAKFAAGLPPKERIAVIVDEAQALSDDALEEFRLLSNLERKGRKAAQIILVGQSELVRRLATPELRHLNERIGARAILAPLTSKESREYIEHRLSVCKGSVRKIFCQRALDYLVQHGGGVPRRINALCHNAMLLAYSADAKRVDMTIAETVVAEYDDASAAVAPRSADQSDGPRHFLLSLLRPMLGLGLLGAFGFAATYLTFDWRVACHLRSLGTAIATDAVRHIVSVEHGDNRPRAGDMGEESQTVTLHQSLAGHAPVPNAAFRTSAANASMNDSGSYKQRKTGRYVVVARGDTLTRIALRYLGSGDAVQSLLQVNPQITNVTMIYPGERVYLPDPEELASGKEQ